MHYIGIDLGGTSIKGAVVTEGGAILKEASCPTQRESGPEHVAREIAGLITATGVLAGVVLYYKKKKRITGVQTEEE